MAGVFISYRREDDAGRAGRLHDGLVARLGPERVYIDIVSIEPGADYADQIAAAVGSCDVLLALIGHRWVDIADREGRRRLDDPEDLVRLEIALALRREDVRVIPVLLEGAAMPRAEQLPPDLQAFARRNAFELSDARWRSDVDRLIEVARRPSGEPRHRLRALPRRDPNRAPRATRARAPIAMLAVCAVAAAGLGGATLIGDKDPSVIGPVDIGEGKLPGRPAVADGTVWVPMSGTDELVRVPANRDAGKEVGRRSIGSYPVAVAAGAGRIWVADAHSDKVVGVDPAGDVADVSFDVGHEPSDIVVRDRIVWTSDCACSARAEKRYTVSRIDPRSGTVRRIPVGRSPVGIGAGAAGIWVTSEDGTVRHLDPGTGRVLGSPVAVGDYPTDVVVDSTGIWVSLAGEDRVVRIDPRTRRLDGTTSIRVGARPWTMAAGGGFLWVAHAGDGSLRRIDPRRRRVVGTPMFVGPTIAQTKNADPTGDGVAWGEGRAWLASRSTGTLRGVKP